MYQIAYGSDTGSIEDPDQLVLLTMPDECADMDTDDLEDYIRDSAGPIDSQPLVGFNDMREATDLAMQAEGIDAATRLRIWQTIFDAVDNAS